MILLTVQTEPVDTNLAALAAEGKAPEYCPVVKMIA